MYLTQSIIVNHLQAPESQFRCFGFWIGCINLLSDSGSPTVGVLIIRPPSDIIRPTGYYPVERIISARFQTKRCKVVVVVGKRNSEFTVVEGLHSSNIYGTRQHICVRTTVLIIRRYPLMSQIIRPFPRLSARFPKGLSAQIRWRSR